MTWFRVLTNTEFTIISLFLFLYLIYGIQMYLISRKIKLSIGRLVVKFTLRSTYLSLIIISLLGPSFGDIKKEIKAIGKDVYFAIDLSNSMNVADVSPSRLEAVKFELTQIIKKLNSERIGLIVFSNEAFVQCPLTYDHKAINLFLNNLTTDLLSSNGTNLSKPIELAIEKFSSTSSDQTRILILVTDGENFGEIPLANLGNQLKEKNIATFFLAVGSKEGGYIPKGKGFEMDKNFTPIISKVDYVKLKSISKELHARVYTITSDKNESMALTNNIRRIEGNLKATKKIDSGANKYFYFLFIALICIVLDVLIMVKSIKI